MIEVVELGLISLFFILLFVYQFRVLYEAYLKEHNDGVKSLSGIPEPIKFETPPDYEHGVIKLTLDGREIFETRNGVYRHYTLEYSKPVTPPVIETREHPFGIHSPI